MSRAKVTKHPSGLDGHYLYRGVVIRRNDRERGYWGHWQADVGLIVHGPCSFKKISTQTRAQLLAEIDQLFPAA
jgi:hypothetical protein